MTLNILNAKLDDGDEVWIYIHHIEAIQRYAQGRTKVRMTSGTMYILREKPELVIEMIGKLLQAVARGV